MKEIDRSQEVIIGHLRQEISGGKPKIDRQKLKWIVQRKKKKWMRESNSFE
jgi:hypothetical protein